MPQTGNVSILITARNAAAGVLRAARQQILGFRDGMLEAANQMLEPEDRATTLGAAFRRLTVDVNQLQGKLVELAALGGFIALLRQFGQAADELAESQRKLEGAARLVGAPLAFANELARVGREQFSLDAIEANRYAAALITLTSKAGDLTKSQQALNDFLELGAARGMGTAEVLGILETAALGNERALRRLFGVKVNELLDETADASGVATSALSEQQRVTSVLTEATNKARDAQGSYAKFVNSTQGALDDANDALKDAQANFGTIIAPMRVLVAYITTVFLDAISSFIGGLQLWATDIVYLPQRALLAVQVTFINVVEFFGRLINKLPAPMKKYFFGDGEDPLAVAQRLRDSALRQLTDLADAEAQTEREITGVKDAQSNLDRQAIVDANKQLQLEQRKREQLEQQAEARKAAAKAAEKAAEEAKRELEALEKANLARQRAQRIEAAGGGNVIGGEARRNDVQPTRGVVGYVEAGTVTGPDGKEHVVFRAITGDIGGASGDLSNRSVEAANAGGVPALLQGLGGDRATQRANAAAAQSGEFLEAIQDAKTFTDEFAQALNDAAAGPLANFIEQGITGFENLGDAARSFGLAVSQALIQIGAQIAANQALSYIFGGLFPSANASGGGGGSANVGGGNFGGGKLLAAPARASLFRLPASAARVRAASPVVVSPNVNLAVNAMDARSVSRLLSENRGAIGRAMIDTLRSDPAFADMLKGR